jgi:uncharacterized membrane protein
VKRQDALRAVMLATSLLLALEIVLWELWLAPLRPGGSMLALLALPLLGMSHAAWRRSNYGLQVSSMLVLVYLVEGVMRALNDHGMSQLLAIIEIVLVALFFCADLAYLSPLKRAARRAKSP